MAVPATLKFGTAAFYLGDGETSEQFTKVCGMTSVKLDIKKDYNDAAVPDCDNPDDPIWAVADVSTQSWTMQVEGFLVPSGLELLEDATWSSAARNVRFRIKGAGTGAGTPDRQYAGPAHVEISLDASLGERMKVTVSLRGDGPLVRSSVAAV